MRKMKKVTALLMAGAMVASMAACGAKQEPAAATTAAQSSQGQLHIRLHCLRQYGYLERVFFQSI